MKPKSLVSYALDVALILGILSLISMWFLWVEWTPENPAVGRSAVITLAALALVVCYNLIKREVDKKE